VTWRREDAAYAAAALAAAALVVYFAIGNFGLVPSPLAPGRVEASAPISVPTLGTPPAAGTSGAPRTVVPQFATQPPADIAPVLTASADRTPPVVRITTSSGAVLSLTQPAGIDGVASDSGSGMSTVTARFTPTAGGAPTVVAAGVVCDGARHNCTWSAGVPAVAGQYVVIATGRDRAANAARSAPVTITVVNGGGPVSTVTGVVNGLLPGAGDAVGGLLTDLSL
jgi:hypothetical protein